MGSEVGEVSRWARRRVRAFTLLETVVVVVVVAVLAASAVLGYRAVVDRAHAEAVTARNLQVARAFTAIVSLDPSVAPGDAFAEVIGDLPPAPAAAAPGVFALGPADLDPADPDEVLVNGYIVDRAETPVEESRHVDHFVWGIDGDTLFFTTAGAAPQRAVHCAAAASLPRPCWEGSTPELSDALDGPPGTGSDTTTSSTTSTTTTSTTTSTTTVPPGPALPGDLVTLTSGFTTFVCSDTHLAGGTSYGTLAAGGDLSFSGQHRIAANTTGSFWLPGEPAPASLVVGGRLDWDSSSGSTSVKSGVIKFGDASNLATAAGNSNQTIVVPAAGGSSPQLRIDELNQQSGFDLDGAVDFDDTCAALAATSTGWASSSVLDAGAQPVGLHGQNGVGEWPGSGSVWMWFAAGVPAVLEVTPAQLAAFGNVNTANGSGARSASAPLVVNVDAAGPVVFSPPNFTQNFARHVVWNFPSATQVTVTGTVWGTILAPAAEVVVGADVRGNVFAGSLQANSGVIDASRSLQVNLPW